MPEKISERNYLLNYQNEKDEDKEPLSDEKLKVVIREITDEKLKTIIREILRDSRIVRDERGKHHLVEKEQGQS